LLQYRGHHFSTSQRRRSVRQLFRQRQTLYCSLFFQFPAFPYGRKRAANVKFPFGPHRFEARSSPISSERCRDLGKSFSRRIDLSVIIFLDRTRCGRLRIIYGEDSHSSPHIPGHFRNYPDDALDPLVRISRDRQASSAEPRTKTTFLNLIARRRAVLNITKLRVDGNVTPLLGRKPATQL